MSITALRPKRDRPLLFIASALLHAHLSTTSGSILMLIRGVPSEIPRHPMCSLVGFTWTIWSTSFHWTWKTLWSYATNWDLQPDSQLLPHTLLPTLIHHLWTGQALKASGIDMFASWIIGVWDLLHARFNLCEAFHPRDLFGKWLSFVMIPFFLPPH